jgi:16S rRNA (uracil1498-N3)-methyltransferase
MHLFYQPHLSEGHFTLIEEELRHCVKVLRHTEGDEIHVTDGRGILSKVRISKIAKASLSFDLIESITKQTSSHQIHLYLSPTKQVERMEWMVEKLCEIGVNRITFIKTQNSERPKLKMDRLLKKTISALKQSKSAWITQINEMISFEEALASANGSIKLLAAIQPGIPHIYELMSPKNKIDIFVGPEGDFTKDEITLAQKGSLELVSLGQNVLRTETAGLYACMAAHLTNR